MKIASQEYRPADFSLGQIQEMMVTLGKLGFSPEMAAIVANAKSGKATQIISLFGPTYGELLESWQTFYRDVFGIEADFSALQVPKRQSGFDRLIIVAQEMTPQRLYDKCVELFPCWKWTDKSLDDVVRPERTGKDGSYAVWVRDTIEADENLRDLFADDLKAQGIPGITLEERLLYELKYFKETGRHLDLRNITLCSGSRYSTDGVPSVGCSRHFGRLFVDWDRPEYRNGLLRARRAVC